MTQINLFQNNAQHKQKQKLTCFLILKALKKNLKMLCHAVLKGFWIQEVMKIGRFLKIFFLP